MRESPLYDDGFAKNVCKICNLEQEGAFSATFTKLKWMLFQPTLSIDILFYQFYLAKEKFNTKNIT